MPFPPSPLSKLNRCELAALRLPQALQPRCFFLEAREWNMLHYKIAVESALQPGIEQGIPMLIPLEKSWQYFRTHVSNSVCRQQACCGMLP